MRGDSHVVIGSSTFAALWLGPDVGLISPDVTRDVGTFVLLLGVVVLASVLPDLDHPRAALAQLRLGRRGLLKHVRPLSPVARTASYAFGHRGLLHSLAALVLIVLAADQLAIPGFALALGWGYGLHLFADAMTRQGVPLLRPLVRENFRLPPPLAITTGSPAEALYVAAILVASAVVSLRHWPG
jgi:membrane-bound metal-dependent hydrolase YbcI (DUF457 family)